VRRHRQFGEAITQILQMTLSSALGIGLPWASFCIDIARLFSTNPTLTTTDATKYSSAGHAHLICRHMHMYSVIATLRSNSVVSIIIEHGWTH